VGCNTALQVGLDGSVNVEKVGGRFIASVGGHADFCEGATRSKGGVSIIAVRSTTANGTSTIVPVVEVVSTPSDTIQIVITEHGIAEIAGTDPTERARRLIAIAAPEHRAGLTKAIG
jgi:acyl-CoA hydrolase